MTIASNGRFSIDSTFINVLHYSIFESKEISLLNTFYSSIQLSILVTSYKSFNGTTLIVMYCSGNSSRNHNRTCTLQSISKW